MKFSTKTIILFLLFVIFSTSISAKDKDESMWAVGFQGGLNISNKHNDNVWGSKTGYNVGVFVDYKLYDFIFLRTGLKYSTKGSILSNTSSTISNNIIINSKSKLEREIGYLHVPLYLGIRIQITDHFAVSGLLGAYIDYGISFKNTYIYKQRATDLSTGTIIDSESEKEKINGQRYTHIEKVDIGAAIGIEGEYKNILLGFIYERGFRNVSGKSDTNTLYNKWRNRNGSIYVGYKFSL